MNTLKSDNGTLEPCLLFTPDDGHDVYSVAREVAAAVKLYARPIVFTYRGIVVVAREGCTPDDLLKLYWTRS